jgi:DNA polymerase III epsilon subunit-like protein
METNGVDPDTCDLVEIACVFLDPDTLSVIPGSEFESLARPENLDEVDDTEAKRKSLSVSGITKQDLAGAPVVGAVVRAFADHVKRVCGRKKAAPAGYNIVNFDLPLYDRLCRQHGLADKDGRNKSFVTGLVLDMKEDVNRWFYNAPELHFPSFDNVRKLFGMSTDRAHRAMFDVKSEAWVLVKMLRLYQSVRPKVQFAGSAAASGGLI